MRTHHCQSIDYAAETCPGSLDEAALEQLPETLGVLVVDDEHLVRIMLELGLERSGFKVWAVSNGREAIELYRTHRDDIDVVLLDVRLPVLDGPETLDGLRSLNPAVLACFMSGDIGAYEAEELQRRGAAYVIAKPFHLGPLVNTLRHLTHGMSANLRASCESSRE